MTLIRTRVLTSSVLCLFFGISVATVLSNAVSAQQLDMEKFEGMKPRNIGPAGMSGRVTAIDAVHNNPDIIYAGTASGGLWVSYSGGVEWKPIFDEQDAHSIGAVAINQKNPDVIWVGTGEGNPRNSMSAGNGLYKSIDGGKHWTHLGLDESRSIHRILLHPDNPNIAYIGALGPAWGETETRGVYKTTDGGETFERVLFVNVKTGPGDMVMDPSNPDHLLVGMWEFRRWPWFFESGGEGSGLYSTYDGGKNWKRQDDEDGLPKGELGRIGLAFAESDPNVAYALVESKKNALYRSTDGGDSWKKVNDKPEVSNRPFYYQDIFVDPANENRVYHVQTVVNVSDDGGRNFSQLMQSYGPVGVHPDHHAFWVDPQNAHFLIEGNDGGLNISRDRGKTWRFAENLPLAQFYHIGVDNELPYNVMGGTQDNGSWIGPAYVWRSGGIRNSYWQEVAFGDGFDVQPDPDDSRYGYAMSQGGNISRFDKETGNSKFIKPLHPDGEILRYNWNAGFAQDPFDAATIYYGSQFVHKSTNRGNTWELISPDLTTNDPEKQKQLESGGLTYDVTQAENFTTIVSMSPSPLQRGVLWVGTDDGNVQLTRDGGATWQNVGSNIEGVAEGSWVTQIQSSTWHVGEAYVVIEDHRRNNWEPYVYRTTDWGAHWSKMVEGDEVWGYALSIVQDPQVEDLFFLGTEFGLYVSIDGADTWTEWTAGYPTASTIDLVIHPRESDLVIGTFGRAAWVLDDIRPLRALALRGPEILDNALTVFEAPDAYRSATMQASGTRFRGNAIYAGENRPRGAMITYSVNPEAHVKEAGDDDNDKADDDAADDDDDNDAAAEEDDDTDDEDKKNDAPDKVKIEILDDSGEVIREFKGPAKDGMNRAFWGLVRKAVRSPSREKPDKEEPEPGGPTVLPGTYTARITYGEATGETQITVHLDPRLEEGTAGIEARSALYDEYSELVDTATAVADRIREAGEIIERINTQLDDRDDDEARDLVKSGKALQDSLDVFSDRFFGPQGKQGIYRDPYTVNSYLGGARRYIQSGYNMPGPTERVAMDKAAQEVNVLLTDVNNFFRTNWPEYRTKVTAANIILAPELESLESPR